MERKDKGSTMEVSAVSKRNFFLRIVLPTLLTVVLFVTVFFVLFIPQFENTIMDRKREMIKELTNSAASIFEKWYNEEKKGTISRAQAQTEAAEQIKFLRYGDEGKDYFWITDFSPVMIMHPYRTDLNGKTLSDFKDSHGKMLFVEMADTAQKYGEGYVSYMWQWKDDAAKIVPKLSYVKAFHPWNWVIGTGIYIEDVREEIAMLEQKIVNVSIIITLAVSVLLIFIAYQSISSEKERRRAELKLQESREKYRALVEASSEALVLISQDQQVFFNKTFYSLLGRDESKPLPSLSELFLEIPSLNSIDIVSLKITVSSDSSTEQAEADLIKEDGSPIHVLINASPILLFDKSGIVLSIKDLSSSLHQIGRISNDSEHPDNLSLFTEKLSIGLFCLQAKIDRASRRKDFTFVYANEHALKIFGVDDLNTLLKISFTELFEDKVLLQIFLDDLLSSSAVKDRTLTLQLANRNLPVSISAILLDSAGRVLPESAADSRILQDSSGSGTFLINAVITDISTEINETAKTAALLSKLESAFLFLNNPIASLARQIPVCRHTASAGDAITLLGTEKSSCLLIVDSDLQPIGFFSESDIAARILSDTQILSLNLSSPISQFMSSPLISIPEHALFFDAIRAFHSHIVSHLVLKNAEGNITGVLRARDLQSHFHASYLFFIQQIKHAGSINELSGLFADVVRLVKDFIQRHINSDDITKFNAECTDALHTRVVELAAAKLGEPPVPFSFIVLGSIGRAEGTLAADQDNAIIFEDVSDDTFTAVQSYFLKLGEMVVSDLNQLGFPFCKGDVMARNKKWCQPLRVWKKYFTDWVSNAEPKDLLDIKIFFDFRVLHGSIELPALLNEHIIGITSGYNPFFVYFSDTVSQFQMPESAVKLKTPFDIKMVMLPLVDCMRLYSLKKKCDETNTMRRLELLYERKVFSKTLYNNIKQAYRFLMFTRLSRQALLIDRKLQPDNLIPPSELSEMDLLLFKKSLAIIEELQTKVRLEFRGSQSV